MPPAALFAVETCRDTSLPQIRAYPPMRGKPRNAPVYGIVHCRDMSRHVSTKRIEYVSKCHLAQNAYL